MPDRSRTHHYIPRFILRGFSRDDVLSVVDLDAGRSYRQSVNTAAAENDFHTVTLNDGTRSDVVERAIAQEIEGPASDALRAMATNGGFESNEQLDAAARFVALQYLRVPSSRSTMNVLADTVLKLEVAAQGPAGVREILEKQGKPADDAAVAEMWELLSDFDDYKLEMPTEHHVQQMLQYALEIAPALAETFTWGVVRYTRKALLIGDTPLALLPDPKAPRWRGVGILNAGGIWLPVDRRTAVILAPRPEPRRPRLGFDLSQPGTAKTAYEQNRIQLVTAERRVFHHPDDQLTDLLGTDEMPDRHVGPRIDTTSASEMRKQLKSMGDWMIANPGEPHPMNPSTRTSWRPTS